MTAGGWTVSYADLDRVSDEVAAGMRARGVQIGDVVALILPPGPEYALSYLAAAKLGAITAGVNNRLTPRERDAVLALAEPRLVITEPGGAPDDHDAVEVPVAGSVAELHATCVHARGHLVGHTVEVGIRDGPATSGHVRGRASEASGGLA